ncbi:uncharacterized protein LOC111643765 [Copidosoma floridanum]|uniref:uncharacterized protein LOC111643765 n=1 Tax=Copidosoma floridanum TaxID=29053 RepID=UPI000C6FB1B8|nr:uncharacterized protein LOC111643765 [Copidosoma floridanum]
MKFASPISNQRICVYLDSIESVKYLCDKVKSIKVNNQEVNIRPLRSRNKRVIISNASPVISNATLIEELKKMGIDPVSHINYLRINSNLPKFSHLGSFRRQIYIREEDEAKLVSSVPVSNGNIVYHVYFSTNKPTCFLCKEKGHLAKDCQQQQTNISQEKFPPLQDLGNGFPPTCSDLNSAQNNYANTVNIPNLNDLEIMPPPLAAIHGKKRHAESDSSSQTSITNPSNARLLKNKPKRKKTEPHQATLPNANISHDEINIQLESVSKHLQDNHIQLAVNWEKLTTFLFLSYGKSNVSDILTSLNVV